MLTANQCRAIRAQQLNTAAAAEIERMVKAANVGDVDRGTGDTAKTLARQTSGEHEGGVARNAADKRFADEESERGISALRQVIGAVAQVDVGRRRGGGTHVQIPRRIEQKQVAYLRDTAHVAAQQFCEHR